MDSIYLHAIECWTHIGVTTEEREREQLLVVSVELFTDTRKVAASDSVNEGVDYAKAVELVQKLSGEERNTVERFAEDVANAIVKKFSVESVKVSVIKRPLPDVESVHITISRP